MAHYNYMPSNPKIGDTCSLTARYTFSEIYDVIDVTGTTTGGISGLVALFKKDYLKGAAIGGATVAISSVLGQIAKSIIGWFKIGSFNGVEITLTYMYRKTQAWDTDQWVDYVGWEHIN
ncbi:hypothetical protein KUA25_23155, partial [Bacteroidales bacterium MSK.15.36]|nr:hypothetical protein [Bacteroidales bacterium MSK.15.36]